MKDFDRKFGELLTDLPTSPAVYLFKDEYEEIIYVGKAKNIRRRLREYRNASQRKCHRKMRSIVKAASALYIQLQPSEQVALLTENRLIRIHKPRFNVDGTFHFLYPAIGIGAHENRLLACFTTNVTAWARLDLEFYGVFRSRVRTLEAYEALVSLLDMIGHQESRAQLPPHPRISGSRFVGIRRVERLVPSVKRFLCGYNNETGQPKPLEPLVAQLLEQRSARKAAPVVEAQLRVLADFECTDLKPLRHVLQTAGYDRHLVAQEERDALFIQYGA